MRMSADEPRGITALLGPTNTGKTHQALERMLEHRSGMIGLPLRLLAREVYDRLTTRVGEREVALVTGEEKRIPAHPRYYVCTVEAMPIDREVDFLAVDEIQLCSHPERGHIFTDRLLRARGRIETWFLGSSTIRPLLERFVPTAKITSRPRLSALRCAPTLSLSRLPDRTAIVAFSTDRVYDIAAQLRLKRGGAAIVLGALSPRTRNAQVALYQSGEVNYMVATDAIGMGLNLSIDHVVFADKNKFDGQEQRPLETAELAQIAGRAGRYLSQGTFGTMAPLQEFSPRVIRAIETHQFPPETQLLWRNSELDFSSVPSLLNSLKQSPKRRGLRLMATAGDHRSFSNLASRSIVRDKLIHAEQIELLWEICQIPDFRQLWFELHVKLLEQLFLQLASTSAQIDPVFIEEHLTAIDDTRGDLDTLLGRIADIRTWTYVATHPRWLSYNSPLRERTAAIEDRLSDALHDRLVSRFVERTRSACIGERPHRARERANQLGPFALLLDQFVAKEAAGARTLPIDWLEQVINGSHEQFNVDSRGRISFGGRRLAQLEAGPDILHPEVRLTLDLDPGKGARSRLIRRLLAFGRDLAATLVTPLRVRAAAQLSPAGRGIVYQLEQNLGTISTDQSLDQLLLLTDRDRQLLTSFGVYLGKRVAYVRRTLTPIAISMRAALVSAQYSLRVDFMDIQIGAPTLALGEYSAFTWLICLGYVPTGRLGIRADHYDFVWQELTRLAKGRTFPFPQYLASKLGCSRVQLDLALQSAGYFPLNSGRYARRSRQQDIWRR